MSRSNGEGSIYKRKDERWCGQITTGRDPKTGKQKRKYFYGKTRKEVAEKMTETLHKLNVGTYIDPSKMLLKEWLEKWLQGRKNSLAIKSWETYEMIIRCHIVPEIGEISLKKLTTRDIQDLINEKYKDGRADDEDGGLSRRTVTYIYSTLQTALKQAVKEHLIPHNVAEAVELPKKKKNRKLQTYNQEQVIKLLSAAKDTPYYTALYLELNTGLRRGELLGLKWKDINFEEKTISIERQLLRTQNKGLNLTDLKTESSYRTFMLSNKVINTLKSYKIKQNENKLVLGEEYNHTGLIFTTENGNPIGPRNFFRAFKRIINKAGLPDIRFHDLRHTFATLSLQAGVPAKTIQQILGHADISTTLNIYGHVTKEMHKEAADTISNIISNTNI